MGTSASPLARYDAGLITPYHPPPPPTQSPDVEVTAAGSRIIDWARDLADNSALIAAILSTRTANAIGPGLSYEPLVRDRRGVLIKEINDSLRCAHAEWSKKVDVTGELTRSELERQMWRSVDVDGEIFIRSVRRRFGGLRQKQIWKKTPRTIGANLPYRLQIFEADLVPIWMTEERKAEWVVNGVGKDEWGAPLRYYILPQYTSYTHNWMTTEGLPRDIMHVPANEMWHMKRCGRPGQTRGISLLAQVIFRTSDLAAYEESVRLAARASADLFASINRAPDMDPEVLFASAGGASGKAMKPDRTGWDFESLQILDGLLAGESVNFHQPQHPHQNAVEYIQANTRTICAACDVSSSQVMQVFGSSYAAHRMEYVDTWRKVERDRSKYIEDFARSALYEEPIWHAIQHGVLSKTALRSADESTLLDVRIDGPQMPVIDPVKDRNAYRMDKEEQWDSNAGIIRRMGRVPADIAAEVAQESATADQHSGVGDGARDE